MATLINTPRLEIDVIDDTWAEIRASFDVDWNENRVDSLHRVVISIRGRDEGAFGGEGPVGDRARIGSGEFINSSDEDYLDTMYSMPFNRSGRNPITVTTIQRIQRDALDEDKGWGLIKRKRRKRDKDEVYVQGRLQRIVDNITTGRPGWRYYGGKSIRSNIVTGRF